MNGGISSGRLQYVPGFLSRVGGDDAGHVEIDVLRRADVDRAATLYREAFPTAFFARLGHRFLLEYYASYLTSPYGGAFVVRTEGRPVAVLAGSFDACAQRTHTLQRHGRKLAVRGMQGLLARPHLALSFVRRRVGWYAGKIAEGVRRPQADGQSDRPVAVAVLDHVLVDPEARGHGWGHLLVESFVSEACDRGSSRAVLVTRADNTRARLLYENLGWTASGEHRTRDGSHVVTYEYVLDVEIPQQSRRNHGDHEVGVPATHVGGEPEAISRSSSAPGSGGANR